MTQMQSSRPVVLVIDDKPAMRTLIRETLEAAGMTIFETNVGSAAVTLFEHHSPDLVLLDIVMPDMKGLETCSRIRSLPRGNRVPVLIMTEHGDADSIAIAYEHGATDFITKPINPMILLHRTRYMLRAKNVLEALIKSEARLELAQRIARIGNWDWEPRTNRFTMSNELCRLVGVRPQDFGGTIGGFSRPGSPGRPGVRQTGPRRYPQPSQTLRHGSSRRPAERPRFYHSSPRGGRARGTDRMNSR